MRPRSQSHRKIISWSPGPTLPRFLMWRTSSMAKWLSPRRKNGLIWKIQPRMNVSLLFLYSFTYKFLFACTVIGKVPKSTKQEMEEAVAAAKVSSVSLFSQAWTTGKVPGNSQISTIDWQLNEKWIFFKAAFKSWSKTSILTRQQVMFRYQHLIRQNMKDLAKLVTLEQGKTLVDAEGDVLRGLQVKMCDQLIAETWNRDSFYWFSFVYFFLSLSFCLGGWALLQYYISSVGRNIAVGVEGHGHYDIPGAFGCLCWYHPVQFSGKISAFSFPEGLSKIFLSFFLT